MLPLQAITLRLGVVVDETTIAAAAPDPRWLHVDDAVQAVTRALAFAPPASGPQTGWWVLHIPGGGSRTRDRLVQQRHHALVVLGHYQ